MAAYHADDIRNLKKMIGFIEDHMVSIEEEKLKKEIFALGFDVLSEEGNILHALFTPFPKFCDEWRFEESQKDAERGAIRDFYGGQSAEEFEDERIRAINRIKEAHGSQATQYEIIKDTYERLDEAASVISWNRIVRKKVQEHMLLCFLARLLEDHVPFRKILQYLDRKDMHGIRDTYLAALRLKGDLALTDEETALIGKVKAEWEETTAFDWDGNVVMEKVMKMSGGSGKETE